MPARVGASRGAGGSNSGRNSPPTSGGGLKHSSTTPTFGSGVDSVSSGTSSSTVVEDSMLKEGTPPREMEHGMTLAEAHFISDLAKKQSGSNSPPGAAGGPVANFTESKWFNGAVGLAVLGNTIQMGVEADNPQHEEVYHVLEHVFTAVFTFEMMSKIVFSRVDYFRLGWNCMDFALVWMSILDRWILGPISSGEAGLSNFLLFRMLRVMRLVRMVRLLKVFRELWLIVKGIMDSVRTIFWAALLLLMVLYCFGIFCVTMIGQNKSAGYYRAVDEALEGEEIDYFPDFDAYQYYGTVPRAMFTLFETCIEPLNIRPVIEKQPMMAPCFLFFIFMTTFGVLNVIIGVIVDNTMEASRETDRALDAERDQMKRQRLQEVRDACLSLAGDGKTITPETLRKGMEQPEVAASVMGAVELPLGLDADELFLLLDRKGKGHKISLDAMMTELVRASLQDEGRQILEVKIGQHRLNGMIRETQKQTQRLETALTGLSTEMGSRMATIEGCLKRLLGEKEEPLPGRIPNLQQEKSEQLGCSGTTTSVTVEEENEAPAWAAGLSTAKVGAAVLGAAAVDLRRGGLDEEIIQRRDNLSRDWCEVLATSTRKGGGGADEEGGLERNNTGILSSISTAATPTPLMPPPTPTERPQVSGGAPSKTTAPGPLPPPLNSGAPPPPAGRNRRQISGPLIGELGLVSKDNLPPVEGGGGIPFGGGDGGSSCAASSASGSSLSQQARHRNGMIPNAVRGLLWRITSPQNSPDQPHFGEDLPIRGLGKQQGKERDGGGRGRSSYPSSDCASPKLITPTFFDGGGGPPKAGHETTPAAPRMPPRSPGSNMDGSSIGQPNSARRFATGEPEPDVYCDDQLV